MVVVHWKCLKYYGERFSNWGAIEHFIGMLAYQMTGLIGIWWFIFSQWRHKSELLYLVVSGSFNHVNRITGGNGEIYFREGGEGGKVWFRSVGNCFIMAWSTLGLICQYLEALTVLQCDCLYWCYSTTSITVETVIGLLLQENWLNYYIKVTK